MKPIKIDGNEYEFPHIDTITMDEALVLYEYGKVTLDQIVDMDTFHPGVVAGLLHVAIKRARPDVTDREIRKTVGGLNIVEIAMHFVGDEEGDAVPPVNTPANENATSDESGRSGNDGPEDGDPSPDSNQPQPIGSLGSEVIAA